MSTGTTRRDEARLAGEPTTCQDGCCRTCGTPRTGGTTGAPGTVALTANLPRRVVVFLMLGLGLTTSSEAVDTCRVDADLVAPSAVTARVLAGVRKHVAQVWARYGVDFSWA